MAAFKVLYVTAGPATLAGVRAINYTQSGGALIATGDNATAAYAGRAGVARGTVTAEDADTASDIIAGGAIASAIFTVKTNAAIPTGKVTVTNFVPTGASQNLGDGTGEGPIGSFDVSFVASSITVANDTV